jgi:RNA polymerase sigma-70 factor (ECF subfamily)
MLRAAGRVLGCAHLAADAVQDTLVLLWQTEVPHGELRGWLVRAVVHRSLHLRRTLLRRQRHEVAAGCCEVACANPLHHAYAQELGEHVQAALAELPAPQRRAFLLRERDGLDYEDIARALAVPLGTVRSRLHRARAALQDRLAVVARETRGADPVG